MAFFNIKNLNHKVSFQDAIFNPIAKDKGLFLPENIPQLSSEQLNQLTFHELCYEVLAPMIDREIPEKDLRAIIARAFNFPLFAKNIQQSHYILELFHGPTLAFKDFGARFLSEVLNYFSQQKITILTATSGDTGAAVAHAFYQKSNIDVVILYPEGKISPEQEMLFSSLGGNIHCLSVKASFDDCQALVKQAFNDQAITEKHRLNSANSINPARLIAQSCYYAALPQLIGRSIDWLSVPCGNFGNLCAGLLAKKMGVPIGQFIAATNRNDTVPRFFNEGDWHPKATIENLSNAMDVSKPNNFSRIMQLYNQDMTLLKQDVCAISIDEDSTIASLHELKKMDYISEPHTAIAYKASQLIAKSSQTTVSLSTAHPAKFKNAVEAILHEQIPLPDIMQECLSKPNLAHSINSDFTELKEYLLAMDK